MDELTIEDKIYISSKRAAKITGYAKDYVGQLAREGHIPAKRIGRNWYVLESAIKDHRFGNEGLPHEDTRATVHAVPISIEQEDTVRPVYKTEPAPSINLIRKNIQEMQPQYEGPAGGGQEAQQTSIEDFHDTWQAWFTAFSPKGAGAVSNSVPATPRPETEPSDLEETKEDSPEEHPQTTDDIREGPSREEEVPIRILRASKEYEPEIAPPIAQPLEPSPSSAYENTRPYPAHVHKRPQQKRQGFGTPLIACVLVLIAIISLVEAFIGAGYADNFIIKYISHKQVSEYSGMTLYKK